MTSPAAVEVGSVALFVRGITFKPDDVVPVGTPGVAACMRTKNVQAELDLADVWGIPAPLVKREDQYLIPGDILVSSANSWNLVGKCCWVPDLPWPATFGGFVSVLRASPAKVDPRYLFRWFASDRIQATVRSFGQQTTNISNLNMERCLKLTLPLPGLAEQRRIAEILDKADALRAKRRAALAQLDTLTQSIFLDMFGDPATNPKAWPTTPLGRLMSEVYRYPTYYEITYEDDGVPEVRGELLNDDGTITSERSRLRYISRETSARFPKTVLAEGDLVMTVRGTVGKIGLVPRILAGANMTANLMRLAPDRRLLDPIFAWHCMQTVWFKAQLANACSSTTILTIKAPDLKRIAVPLPPLATQAQFREWISRVEELKTSMCVSLGKLDALFASLQQRAFKGEL
jgi:type I restriction enzyme S subunit